MTSISYREGGSMPSPREENKRIAEYIKERMFLGQSVISGGGCHCDFYYSSSPVGFANVMTWKGDNLAVRLVAPDKFILMELTKILGVPYDERVLEGA